MKIAKNIKVILCDDIRQELGNKISLMGLYSGMITINVKPPAALSKLHIVVMLEDIKEDCDSSIVKIALPKSNEIEIKQKIPPIFKKGADVNLTFGIAPFLIADFGSAKIEITFIGKKKYTIVHKFEIKPQEPEKNT
jgi:hypothetical protein